MRGYFIGRDVKCLADQEECQGIRIWHLNLMEEEFGHMACRIHTEICLLYVKKGSILCQIDQYSQMVYEGEGLFVNAENAWRLLRGSDASEIFLFEIEPTQIFDTNSVENYVKEIINNIHIPYLYIKEQNAAKYLEYAGVAAENRALGFEMEIKGFLNIFWVRLFRKWNNEMSVRKRAAIRESNKLLSMLNYLHKHYDQKITLSQMANDSGVSSGEYCRFFKKRMNQTPVEYLQVYRIEQTLPEVLEKAESITEIVLKHGFTGSSYYAEIFKKEMGCAPGDYRKWYRKEVTGACPLKMRKEEKKAAEQVAQQLKKETIVPAAKPAAKRKTTMPTHLL